MPSIISRGLGTSGGAGDPPQIAFSSPNPNESIPPGTPLHFTVTATASIQILILMIQFPSLGIWEVAFDSSNFGPNYTNAMNVKSSISGGYSFSLLRDGGWLDETVVLAPYVVDATGAKNV